MKSLRVFVDFATNPELLKMLQEGVGGNQLVFPRTPVTSILAKAEPDPAFATVDVAFGQPDLHSIEEARNLRWVHISTSGITRYDTAEFRGRMAARGIPVTNSASVYNEACAAQALCFMLAQARRLPLSLKSRIPNGSREWHALRGACGTLRGETVLIVGYGAIGRRLAELLAPFGMRVLGFRRAPRGDEAIPMVAADQLDRVLAAEADHVVNILPDNADTRRYFDLERLSGLKPGAVFYNIGRGTTVDQLALAEVLRAGRLGAAWLDVTDPEPLPDDHPLWAAPNCHITPHIAGGHDDEAKTLVRHFLANFRRFTQGEPLLDRVM